MAVREYGPTPRKETKLRSRTRSTNSTRRRMWHYCATPSTSRPCDTTTSATCSPASSMLEILYSDEFKVARTSTSYRHLGRGHSSSTKFFDLGHTRSSTRTGGSSPTHATLLTVHIRIKFQVDLQADKSSVVVKGPSPLKCEPKVSNPWNNVRCKNQSNKAKNYDLQKEKPMHLILKNIMKTNLIYESRR
jgi:hypothetical protein